MNAILFPLRSLLPSLFFVFAADTAAAEATGHANRAHQDGNPKDHCVLQVQTCGFLVRLDHAYLLIVPVVDRVEVLEDWNSNSNERRTVGSLGERTWLEQQDVVSEPLGQEVALLGDLDESAAFACVVGHDLDFEVGQVVVRGRAQVAKVDVAASFSVTVHFSHELQVVEELVEIVGGELREC